MLNLNKLTLLKFSSEDCGTCHKMSHYDSKVADELNCEFIGIMIQDTNNQKAIYSEFLN